MSQHNNVTWQFHRLGGIDQVTLETAAEIRALDSLDPKLWAALSCPAEGLEFDSRALDLIDTDDDKRVRIPEVIEAVRWFCDRVKDPAAMVRPDARMPLDSIATGTPHGQRLLASARSLLESIGKQDAEAIGREDVEEAISGAARLVFNGDGILPPRPEFGQDVRRFIEDALAVTGGMPDAGGEPGVNQAVADAFMLTLRDWYAWKQAVSGASSPLGEDTAEAWTLLQELREKIDDYFLRCDLAAYAPESSRALSAFLTSEDVAASSEGNGLLDMPSLSALPLARVEAGGPLRLWQGINPAWHKRVAKLFSLLAPFMADPAALTKEEWENIRASFALYAEVLEGKPVPAAADVLVMPDSSPEALGEERVKELLESDAAGQFAALAAKDAAAPSAAADIAEVERLVVYYQNLHRLLMNFVSFHDFYSLRGNAVFQAGTLYIDEKSCLLCLPVDDVDKHAALASFSHVYLLYCHCRRTVHDAADSEERTMRIVAAVTAGSADSIMEGRNGVFVDNRGEDWDATVVKVVNNPISLWQALWDPYKRFGRMLSEQIAKLAGARQDSLTASAAQRLEQASATPEQSAAQPFDIGKSVGIFAAIGLALGAIGTAVASLAGALFSLQWWQFPLVILALFLIISGPSLVLAWLKLRKRTLGPLLEASGWAVNSRAKINFTLGKALTGIAALPPNARRSMDDPLKKPRRWPYVLAFIVAAAFGAALWLYCGGPGSEALRGWFQTTGAD